MAAKRQRIRDPVYNLIEFNEGDSFERMLWRVIRTEPFQRLRRIRQLGFSDLVYPGATHSRFAHSVGVFHTARQLMGIVKRYAPDLPEEKIKAEAALAAALVHDVGHGPFSHAFEGLGEHFGWKYVEEHENHTEALVRSTQPGSIGEILNAHAEGFADMVAANIRGGPATVYRSVVSSQFDADRLDYVRRDRLMSGTQLAGIDFEWLMANLEIGELPPDGENIRRKTFVLGPKAIFAAEAFVIGLFQMYPTVYFHKTTRAAEKIMLALLRRTLELVRDGDIVGTGLPNNHPLVKLYSEPDNLSVLGQLDDSVILGALPMLRESTDVLVREFAQRLRSRKLFKAIELRPLLMAGIPDDVDPNSEHQYRRRQEGLTNLIAEWVAPTERRDRVLLDSVARTAYKPIEDEGPMNQIWIRDGEQLFDLKDRSPAVAATRVYRAFRAYVAGEDEEARNFVTGAVANVVRGGQQ